MRDTNTVVLVGRLTRDAELKYTAGGTSVCTFSLAVNGSKKQGDQWVDDASFFDVTLFGRSAESLHRFLTKGQQIAVNGHLKQERWETDGQKRSKVVVIAESVQLLGGKRDADQSSTQADDDVPF